MFDLDSFFKQVGATLSFMWNLWLSLGAAWIVIGVCFVIWSIYMYKKGE